MGLIQDLFRKAPCPPQNRAEVKKMVNELINIGSVDDFLSERPGSPFNLQCRHIEAIRIGKRLDEIGGFDLMEYAYFKVRRKLGSTLGDHLDYAWRGIGNWLT